MQADKEQKESKQLRNVACGKIRGVWSRYASVDEENEAWGLLRKSEELRKAGR